MENQEMQFRCRWCKQSLALEACVCASCSSSGYTSARQFSSFSLVAFAVMFVGFTAIYFAYSQFKEANEKIIQIQQMQKEYDNMNSQYSLLSQVFLGTSLSKLSSMTYRMSYSCGITRSLRYEFTKNLSKVDKAQVSNCHSDTLELVSEVQRNIKLAKSLGTTGLSDGEVVAHIDAACGYLDSIGFAVYKNGSTMGRNSVAESRSRSDTVFAMSAEEIVAKSFGADASDCYTDRRQYP